MQRSEKTKLIEEVTSRIKDSSILLCADYRGLTVKEVSGLRSDLREAGAISSVVKNTFLRQATLKAYDAYDEESKAAKEGADESVTNFVNSFFGPSLIISTEGDPIQVTKILQKSADDFDALSIKAGFFEGEFLDSKKIVELSKMPSKEELVISLLRLLQAPATQLLRTINEPGSQIVRLLGAQQRNIAA